MGIIVTMNRIGRSHIKPNNGMGKLSGKFRLFTNSRIMKGSMNSKLMSAGDLRFVKIFFILFPSVIGRTYSSYNTIVQHKVLDNSVEMPGIEPGSERLDPRKSTSVACRTLSRVITGISAGR